MKKAKRDGRSPRGRSPRGRSPRGRSPRRRVSLYYFNKKNFLDRDASFVK